MLFEFSIKLLCEVSECFFWTSTYTSKVGSWKYPTYFLFLAIALGDDCLLVTGTAVTVEALSSSVQIAWPVLDFCLISRH